MPQFGDLLIVVAVAFAAPFALGLFPRLRLPSVVLEIIAGIVIGPSVLGLVEVDQSIEVVALVLLGVAVAVSRRFGAWIGSVAVAAGSLALAIGIDIAYRGAETEFYKLSSVAYQLLVLVFIVGILIAEVRPRARPSMVRTP